MTAKGLEPLETSELSAPDAIKEIKRLGVRLIDDYDFQCEAGSLSNCRDWQRMVTLMQLVFTAAEELHADFDRQSAEIAMLTGELETACREHTDMMWQRQRADERAEAAEAAVEQEALISRDLRDALTRARSQAIEDAAKWHDAQKKRWANDAGWRARMHENMHEDAAVSLRSLSALPHSPEPVRPLPPSPKGEG